MLSVVIPARNARMLTLNCLSSLQYTFRELGNLADVEFILIDDHSDPEQGITDLYKDFRRQVKSAVTIVRFRERRYYAWGCAYGFARAKGSQVLFLSYDMALTPEYVRAIEKVAAMNPSYGIVRGTSEYVDCFPQYQYKPPLPPRSLDDLASFANYVSKYYGLMHSEDNLLTGDAMLIKRSVFDKIGSFDTRYPFGYFSDIDFGLRTMRAGFKMVCARGAWLHHEGAGAYKDETKTKNIDPKVVFSDRMANVRKCYEVFRQKWDPTLTEKYDDVDIHFVHLRTATNLTFDEYQPFVPVEDPLVEIL